MSEEKRDPRWAELEAFRRLAADVETDDEAHVPLMQLLRVFDEQRSVVDALLQSDGALERSWRSLGTQVQDVERRLVDLAKGYRDIAGNEESDDPVEKGGALGMLSGLFDSIEKLANETNIRTYDNRKAIEEMGRRVETQAGILERFVSVGELVDRAALDKAIATLGAAVHDRVRKLEARVQDEVLDVLPGLITESVGKRINEALGELDEAFDWALRYRDEVIRRARRPSLVGALVERLRGG